MYGHDILEMRYLFDHLAGLIILLCSLSRLIIYDRLLIMPGVIPGSHILHLIGQVMIKLGEYKRL